MDIFYFLFFLPNSSFPGSSVVKNPSANAGDMGFILGFGISPGDGNGNPLQDSCLGNPMDRGAWWAIVHEVAKESDTDSLPAEPPGKPKNTGVGSLSLLQQIFPNQESTWGFLHCRQILYQLSYQGSLKVLPPKIIAE